MIYKYDIAQTMVEVWSCNWWF